MFRNFDWDMRDMALESKKGQYASIVKLTNNGLDQKELDLFWKKRADLPEINDRSEKIKVFEGMIRILDDLLKYSYTAEINQELKQLRIHTENELCMFNH